MAQPDPRPQLEHVDAAEPLAEHVDDARRWGASAAAASCSRVVLPAPFGPEHDPALVLLDRPVDSVEQRVGAAAHRDVAHPDDLVRMRGSVARPRRVGRPGHRGEPGVRGRHRSGGTHVAILSDPDRRAPCGPGSASGTINRHAPHQPGTADQRRPPDRQPASRTGAPSTTRGARVRRPRATATAEAVELCLLDRRRAERRVRAGPSRRPVVARVGRRVSTPGSATACGCTGRGRRGPGVRTDPAKLLVDPWAREIGGRFTSLDAALAHTGDDPFGPRARTSTRPGRCRSGWCRPRWRPSSRTAAGVPWRDTVLYETHVRDLTSATPTSPPQLRGTYGGVAHPAVVEHLRRLGVTTVELLPVFANAPEPSLMARGAAQPLGLLDARLPRPGAALRRRRPARRSREFRAMVDALHAAGLEVVLDVVFNHTCEGGVGGPSLSWRGLDAAVLVPARARRPRHRLHRLRQHASTPGSCWSAGWCWTACGTGSRRCGVDGFRFDLASTLGRPGGSAFSTARSAARRDRSGPGARDREADRRAVGRDRRGLPGRRVPAGCGRSGTGATATACATSGAGTGRSREIVHAVRRARRTSTGRRGRRRRRSTS